MIQSVRATPSLPLALDGLGKSTTCDAPVCGTQLLTTTKGHDVIILIVECGDGSLCNNVSTVSDSAGLTFVQRISYSTGDGLGTKLWEYYAIADSPLKSDNITVVTDTCKATVYCIEGMQVVAVNGANTRAVFDRNPSIPATCAGLDCGVCGVGVGTCSVSIQTSTIDFVIASTAINDAPPCGLGYPNGIVPGFTNILNQESRFEVDYAITTTPQSNVTVNCQGTDDIAMVVDAISFYGAFST